MYRPTTKAITLAALAILSIDAYVSSNPGLPADQVRAAAETHNLAIDLVAGQNNFATAYFQDDPKNPTPYDPGPTAVVVEDIAGALCQCYDPSERPNDELMHDRVLRLAQIDPTHPMAANWRVLRARTFPFADSLPDWADVAALVTDPV